MTKEYEDYLLSPAWKVKRKQAFAHHGKKCAKCHRTKNLQIHHKTYANIYNEPMEDLMVVCKKHHEEIHGIKTEPSLADKVNRKKRKNKSLKKTHISKEVKFKFRGKKKNKVFKEKKPQKPKNFYPALDAMIAKKQEREARRMRVTE